MHIPNCWEMKGCGREVGGQKVGELGVCPAAQRDFGHSCWAVAGTMCGGQIQGTFAQKEKNCLQCDVFHAYNRSTGTMRNEVLKLCVDEARRYWNLVVDLSVAGSKSA